MTLSRLSTSSLYNVGTGIVGAGNWASVTATTGSPTTGTYTDANGIAWKWYRWTGSGSVTTTAGLIDALLVASGNNAAVGFSAPDIRGYGAPGNVLSGIRELSSATHTVTVGTAWSINGTATGRTSLGSTWTTNTMQAIGVNSYANGYGYVSSITGTALEYAVGADANDPAVTNAGYGNGVGANVTSGATNGVVIIRVPTAFALV